MMHNLVADSADTSTVVCCCSYIINICYVLTEGFPQYVYSPRAKWRWDRSVHFAENRPNPQRRVLLRSLLLHFWYTCDTSLTMSYFLEHFDELTAQDASSWSRIQVSWSAQTVLCIPACQCLCLRVCILPLCVTAFVVHRMITNLNR